MPKIRTTIIIIYISLVIVLTRHGWIKLCVLWPWRLFQPLKTLFNLRYHMLISFGFKTPMLFHVDLIFTSSYSISKFEQVSKPKKIEMELLFPTTEKILLKSHFFSTKPFTTKCALCFTMLPSPCFSLNTPLSFNVFLHLGSSTKSNVLFLLKCFIWSCLAWTKYKRR